MAFPLAAVLAGAGAIPGLAAALRRSKKLDVGAIMRLIDQVAPLGNTSSDYIAAEGTKSRLTATAEATARHAREEATSRAIRRGGDSAPALEATMLELAQQLAGGREHAGDVADEQLSNMRVGRERFRQSLLGALTQAQIGEAGASADRDALRQSEAINSVLDYIPGMVTALKPATTVAPTAASPVTKSFDASTGRLVGSYARRAMRPRRTHRVGSGFRQPAPMPSF